MDLRTARQKKGLTQDGLAKKARRYKDGLHQVTIALIETGRACPQNGTRQALEKALGVKVDWLATIGLRSRRQGEMTGWELVDQRFREALHSIKSLQRRERIEFMKLARRYLREFEREEIKSGQR